MRTNTVATTAIFSALPRLCVEMDISATPKWISAEGIQAMKDVVMAAIQKAGLTGTIQVTFLNLARIRNFRNTTAFTMSLNRGLAGIKNAPTSIGAVLVGDRLDEICGIQINLQAEAKAVLVDYFDTLASKVFQHYPELRILPS